VSELTAIQGVVDAARHPINVVGSAVTGNRQGVGSSLPIGKGIGTRSDIDYIASTSSIGYFNGVSDGLPSPDVKGIQVAVPNPHIGPSIQFSPGGIPRYD
jgi:hypothetical protein